MAGWRRTLNHLDVWLVTGLLVLLGVAELWWASPHAARQEGELIVDAVSLGQFAFIIKPLIVLIATFGLSHTVPGLANRLADLPLWQGVLLALLPADLLHYWYHRLGHEVPVMWGMHRTHHTATSMSVSVSFRENWRWFALMPDLWYASALVFLGLGQAVLISTLIFGLANVLVHSGLAWDRPLYRSAWLRPVAWVLERLVNLPSTHRAHHALSDGSAPSVNFGQLFLWDTLFGTARYPHGADPEAYGVANEAARPWYAQLWSSSS
jgi:sterol desaturase/sphingolipid hydroxylase (fatty acid hydroxylase superfamily)